MTKPPEPLTAAALDWRIDADFLGPEPLSPSPALPGQADALDALARALAHPAAGHLLVTGLDGADRAQRFAEAARPLLGPRRAPRDLLYVARPRDPSRPRLLVLPAGTASAFRRDLLQLRDELRLAWPDDLDAAPAAWDAALGRVFAPVRAAWPDAAPFLDELQQAVVARADLFRPGVDVVRRGRDGDLEAAEILAAFRAHAFHRAGDGEDAPLVVVPDGRLDRLYGGIHPPAEGEPLSAGLRPGLLHAAHGGLLVIDARDLDGNDAAWMRLRTALATGALAPDSLDAGRVAAIAPDPVPLDVQVALIASSPAQVARWASDPDLQGLFRQPILFRGSAPLTPDLARQLGGWLAHRLPAAPALGPAAVACLLEDLVQASGRGGRVSLDLSRAEDLARAAAHRATADGAATVSRAHVQAERDLRRHRTRLAWDRALESIDRDQLHLRTDGLVVGQANGLAVYRGSGFAFARPIRITATVGSGRGGLVDVEREVGLSGKLHQKGMRMLTGLVRGHFSRGLTLSIQASIGIEQHYGQIDGDSASLAEACALVSAIARVPLRQDLAVTGSVDQLGRVQSVGSLGLKIEGFHAVCAARGLTGAQGVLVPAVNTGDLLLSEEIRADVDAGLFRIFPVESLEEALALLTGLEVGAPGAESWPEDTLYGHVQRELEAFELVNRKAARGPGTK